MNRLLAVCCYIAPLCTIGLIILQIIVSNQLGMLGRDLRSLSVSIDSAKAIHEQLATEVASASSMMTLESRALSRGFHEPGKDNLVILDTSIPVAFANIRSTQ
jgi:hypothetical protein